MAMVLVVNDDHDMLALYEAHIREIGHDVVTEPKPFEATELERTLASVLQTTLT